MKKIILTLMIVVLLTGCTTTKSYTYKVETNDSIKITLKTNNSYNMTSKLPIDFKKDDEVIANGTFLTLDGYDYYYNAVQSDSDAKLIKESTKDNIEYIYYSYDNREYNYIIKIKNSNTAFLIGSMNESEVTKLFDRLTFELE